MSKLFRALIMGAPGSGKGTISNRIVERFKVMHLSSGDILRKNIEQKTEFGIEAEKLIKLGKLIPDEQMNKSILNELKSINGSFLLDGFPRTKAQAERLWEDQKIDFVISLDVPYEIIIDRVKSRYVHMPSGRVYNLDFNPPKVPLTDDLTGDALVRRPDDDPDTVRKRLTVYDDHTKPVIEFYKSKGLLTEFNGNTSKEIWTKLMPVLDKKFK